MFVRTPHPSDQPKTMPTNYLYCPFYVMFHLPYFPTQIPCYWLVKYHSNQLGSSKPWTGIEGFEEPPNRFNLLSRVDL